MSISIDQHIHTSIAEYRVEIKKEELRAEEERLNLEVLKELSLEEELSEEYSDKADIIKVELNKHRTIDEKV